LINTLFSRIQQAFVQIQWYDGVDILILTTIIYQLIKVTRETRANQLLKGFGILIIAAQISQWLNLSGVAWVLNSIVNAGVIALVILFQPELRRALERLGSGRLPDNSLLPRVVDDLVAGGAPDEIARAVQNLAKKRTGALIALQRVNTLSHIVDSGVLLDARVNSQLIENIFIPNSPLHDGAMIVSGERIVAAGCFLPLATNTQIDPELGTRHRAAIGMTETTDALVIIVSEETGIISVAESGRLVRYLDANGLRQELAKVYGHKTNTGFRFNGIINRRNNGSKKGS
jgi:diadenylate cyclase